MAIVLVLEDVLDGNGGTGRIWIRGASEDHQRDCGVVRLKMIGMPFSLEGFAFFTEASFLGIYLRMESCFSLAPSDVGVNRCPQRNHDDEK